MDIKEQIFDNHNIMTMAFNKQKVFLAMDDFAIKFAEWKERNYFHEMHELYRSNKEEHGLYSLTELLEIFKKPTH